MYQNQNGISSHFSSQKLELGPCPKRVDREKKRVDGERERERERESESESESKSERERESAQVFPMQDY